MAKEEWNDYVGMVLREEVLHISFLGYMLRSGLRRSGG